MPEQPDSHTTLSEQDSKILRAAYDYADAVAVLRGQPPFSAWDAMKIELTHRQLLAEVIALSNQRLPGPSIPDKAHAPAGLAELIKRFLPVSQP
jgi:hypothetical protein